MLRSLLIGFMILSALTSNGAEVQILKSDLTISADILLEFINTVTVQNSKAAELSSAKMDRSSCANASFDNREVNTLFVRLRRINPIACLKQCDQTDQDLKGELVFQKPISSGVPQAFFCVSGLSPPTFNA